MFFVSIAVIRRASSGRGRSVSGDAGVVCGASRFFRAGVVVAKTRRANGLKKGPSVQKS